MEQNVKFRNTDNEISLKTGDTSLPIKTLESINNHHSNDYSTNKVEKFEKENHHPPPIEDIVDMSDQTDMESNCQDGNNLKELKVTDKMYQLTMEQMCHQGWNKILKHLDHQYKQLIKVPS